jgi:hypothetical protein
MKKSIVITLFILGMISLNSCQKQRTCVCEVNKVEFNSIIEASPKKDQKIICDGIQASYKSQDPAASCKLE